METVNKQDLWFPGWREEWTGGVQRIFRAVNTLYDTTLVDKRNFTIVKTYTNHRMNNTKTEP